MKILFLTFEQTTINHPAIFDFLTSPDTKAGKNSERYWMINTDVPLANPHGDYEVEKMIVLLHQCIAHGFTQLMIGKCLNSTKSEEQSETASSDSNQKT
jgi:hypothetical protein